MIKKSLWNNSSLFEILPNFICPHCEDEKLGEDKSNILEADTEGSRFAVNQTGLRETYFSKLLRCNDREFCGQVVLVSGEKRVFDTGEKFMNYDTGKVESDYKQMLLVNYINPPINIINLTRKIPLNIKKLIEKSFSLFWIDENSCANKIRHSLELLMDEFSINKSYTLHKRIDLFSKENPHFSSLAELLLALKWIGNEGSHSGHDLKREHLIEGYEILEAIFDKLYSEKFAVLLNKAKEINKNKGITNKN
jgi:hypothetical protein